MPIILRRLSREDERKIMQILENFILRWEVTSGESVMQTDGPNQDSVQIIADIVDVMKPDYFEAASHDS